LIVCFKNCIIVACFRTIEEKAQVFGLLIECHYVCDLHAAQFVYREVPAEAAWNSVVEEKARFAGGR
jgi:hypothetical protein